MHTDYWIERTTCWCLPGNFETLWSRRWRLSTKNCYWRWNLAPLPSGRNQWSKPRMAPYLLTKTKKIPPKPSVGKVMLTLFWDEWGVILKHFMPRRNTVTSATYADLLKNHLCPAIKTKRHEVWVQVFCCNMTMLGPILPVELSLQSKICPSSVFHIRHNRQTSPQAILTSLDHAKRWWEASLSDPMRRCRWNAMESM